MKRHCWILRIATAAAGCAILMGISLIGYRLPGALGYCLNLTPSEPVGIYRLVEGGAERGAFVWLKQPVGPAASILHRYAPANIPLIKRVAAIPGDVVQVGTLGIRIDGTLWRDSAPLDRDAEGRSLPAYPFGTYRVRAGQLWVMSDHSRGIDSRYFGPVPETSVISRVVPVITWPSPIGSQALAFAYVIAIAAVAMLFATMSVNKSYALIITPRELRQQSGGVS
jgi:conjugative transfer signal peptidase TraF